MLNFLNNETDTLEKYFPGLDAELAELGIERLEEPDGTAMSMLRDRGITKLLIDRSMGGQGASVIDFVRIQTALGRRAPSMAVASCMHHYKLAALASEARSNRAAEIIYQTLVSQQTLLLASGGAEGKTEQRMFRPSVILSGTKDKLCLNGIKRPCSLSQSMTHLSGMAIGSTDSPYPDQLMHFFINADQEGVRHRPFWKNPVLMASESHEVFMENAVVAPSMLLPLGTETEASSFAFACYGWFNLSACAVYTGVLAALIEIVSKPAQPDLGRWAIQFGELQELVCSVANELETRSFDQRLLSRMFRIRFSAERIIAKTALDCFSHVGAAGYGLTTLPMLLLNVCLAMQFHPPRRHHMEAHLGEEMLSGKLQLS